MLEHLFLFSQNHAYKSFLFKPSIVFLADEFILVDRMDRKKSVEKWFEGVSPKNMKRMKWGAVVGLLLIANPVYNVNPGHRALIFDRRSGLEDKVHRLIQYLWSNFGHG